MRKDVCMKKINSNLLSVLQDVRGCQVCEPHLPFGANPLLAATPHSRILLVGQAPGRVAHESGVPWSDRSGERLRNWLGISARVFYDAQRIAIVPMGFCYPGKGKTGDLAPRPECAPLWHGTVLASLRSVELTIYLGRYAFEYYLKDSYEGLTLAVRDFNRLLPARILLPHPSPRNAIWIKQHSWFEASVLPALKARVAEILD